MKTLPLIAAALASAAPATGATLDDDRWHHRLLIVFAPDRASEPLRVQQRSVAAATAAFAERDLRVIEVIGDRVQGTGETAAALRTRFAVRPPAFRALLVGKDGRVAIDSAAPLATPRLVGTIDAMPMRRQEMARTGRPAATRR